MFSGKNNSLSSGKTACNVSVAGALSSDLHKQNFADVVNGAEGIDRALGSLLLSSCSKKAKNDTDSLSPAAGDDSLPQSDEFDCRAVGKKRVSVAETELSDSLSPFDLSAKKSADTVSKKGRIRKALSSFKHGLSSFSLPLRSVKGNVAGIFFRVPDFCTVAVAATDGRKTFHSLPFPAVGVVCDAPYAEKSEKSLKKKPAVATRTAEAAFDPGAARRDAVAEVGAFNCPDGICGIDSAAVGMLSVIGSCEAGTVLLHASVQNDEPHSEQTLEYSDNNTFASMIKDEDLLTADTGHIRLLSSELLNEGEDLFHIVTESEFDSALKRITERRLSLGSDSITAHTAAATALALYIFEGWMFRRTRSVRSSHESVVESGAVEIMYNTLCLLLMTMIFAVRADEAVSEQERKALCGFCREVFDRHCGNVIGELDRILTMDPDVEKIRELIRYPEERLDIYMLSAAMLEEGCFMNEAYLENLAASLSIEPGLAARLRHRTGKLMKILEEIEDGASRRECLASALS